MTPCQHCGLPHPPGTPNCPRTGESMSQPGPVGTRIDRYQVESLLGSGGFGAVYRARHVHTEGAVALKVLKKALGADGAMVERFLREARAAAAVGSEHIVRVLDAGQATDGTPFLALELLEGADLQGLAQQVGPLPPMRLVLLALQVLEGLDAAHRKGIVHRDMKPANVFVVRKTDDRGTDKDFVKLLDFGISKMHADGATTGLTMTGMAMGTPSYMAPEQFFDARSVDARADVYSVAVMLYELLAGRLPIEATSYADLIVRVKTEAPVHLSQLAPQVPKALADAVMVGLAKDKEHRWPSAREFANGLRGAMGLPLPGNTPVPPRATLPPQAQPMAQAMDSESMISGKTAAPKLATPAPVPAPRAPSPAPMAPTPNAQPAVAPAPSAQAWAPQAPASPTPAPPTPNAQGWVVPGGAAPVAPRPVAPAPSPSSGGGGALKWVAIIGGSLAGLCCLCLGIGSASNSLSSGSDPSAPSTTTARPSSPEPAAPANEAPPADEVPPTDRENLDPNGTEIYDSLKLDPKTPPEDLEKTIINTLVKDFPIPTKDEVRQALRAQNQDPDSNAGRKLLKAVDRLAQLKKVRQSRELTADEIEEVSKLMDALDELDSL